MKKILGTFLLIGAAVFAQEGFAASPAGTADAAEGVVSVEGQESLNGDMSAQVVLSAGEQLQNAFAEYADTRKIAYGDRNANGTIYVTGQCAVVENSNSANFIKSRTFAYERAYQDAVAAMVMDLTGKNMTESMREIFEDEGDSRYEVPGNLGDIQSRISAKVDALTEAELDDALANYGVDPSSISGTDLRARKELFKNAILRNSVNNAAYASAGFLPVQTFESRTADGRYAIGVVLRYDEDCKEIAKCLARKARPVITQANGLTLKEALPTDEEMLTQFGVRIYFDETGMPSLLSFAQFGSSETSTDPRRQERALEHAMEQAKNLADQQLTLFINGAMSVTEENALGETESEELVWGADADAFLESANKIIDRKRKSSTSKGTDTLAGRSTVYKKILTHPSGHKVAVVVRRWSFEQLDAVNAIKSGKKATPKPVPGTQFKKEDSGVRQGRSYDF